MTLCCVAFHLCIIRTVKTKKRNGQKWLTALKSHRKWKKTTNGNTEIIQTSLNECWEEDATVVTRNFDTGSQRWDIKTANWSCGQDQRQNIKNDTAERTNNKYAILLVTERSPYGSLHLYNRWYLTSQQLLAFSHCWLCLHITKTFIKFKVYHIFFVIRHVLTCTEVHIPIIFVHNCPKRIKQTILGITLWKIWINRYRLIIWIDTKQVQIWTSTGTI